MKFNLFLFLTDVFRVIFCETFSCEYYFSRKVEGVFLYDRNRRYSLTFKDGMQACERDFRATMASRAQLQTAYEAGLEECRAGWILGGEVAYPRVNLNWRCGLNQTGVISYGVRKDLSEKWDVFCYKTDNDCTPFNVSRGVKVVKATKNGPPQNVVGSFPENSPTQYTGMTAKALGNVLQQRNNLENTQKMTIPPAISLSSKLETTVDTWSDVGAKGHSPSDFLARRNEEHLNSNTFSGERVAHYIYHPTTQIPISVEGIKDEKPSLSVTSENLHSPVMSWSAQNAAFKTTVPLTNITSDITVSLGMSHDNNSFQSTEQPQISIPLLQAKSAEMARGLQPKKTQDSVSKSPPLGKAINWSEVQISKTFSNSSIHITHHKPIEFIKSIFVSTSRPSTSMASMSHRTVLWNVSKKGRMRNSTDPPTSQLNEKTDVHRPDSTQKQLDPQHPISTEETQRSESTGDFGSTVDYLGLKLTGEFGSTRAVKMTNSKLTGTDATDISVTSPPVVSVGQNPKSSSIPVSMEEDTTSSIDWDDYTYKTSSDSPMTPFSVTSQTKRQQYDVMQKTVLGAYDASNSTETEAKTQDVVYNVTADMDNAQEVFSTLLTVTTTTSNFHIDKKERDSFVNLNHAGNISDGTGTSSNQFKSVSFQAKKLLVDNINQTEAMRPVDTLEDLKSASFFTQSSSKHLKTQDVATAPSYKMLDNKDIISSVLENVSQAPMPTEEILQSVTYDLKTVTTNHKPTYFMNNNNTAEHHTPAVFLLPSESLTTVSDVKHAATTSLDSTIGTFNSAHQDISTKPMPCGELLEGENGKFESPGFPKAYLSNMDCTWVITVPQGYHVQLVFQSLVLEEQMSCQYDYIAVLEGDTANETEVARFCGSELPLPFRSSSSKIVVKMKTDSTVELDGFSVQFQSIKPPTARIQLRGSWNQLGGWVEVEVRGIRGTVCAKKWGKNEAKVVCRQLGFLGNAIPYRMSEDQDDLPVMLSYMSCLGNESLVDQCEMRRGELCSSKERAAVYCQIMESCSVLRSTGVTESGTYLIDPDGADRGLDPFFTFCDMTSQTGTGVTVVGHNSESQVRVSPCEEAGCYSRRIVYHHASMQQLRALVETSVSCTQYVKLECRYVRFLGARWGWWTSWDGRRVDSWGAAATNSQKCECGEKGECDLKWLSCNCDADDEVWRTDEGFLSDLDTLPMREVRFGDTRDVPMEMAFHTIGPLRCIGHKLWQSRDPGLPSCAALKESGVVQSGQFVIDPDGMGQGFPEFVVYCDMTSDPLTGITVVGHDGEQRERVTPCDDPGCYTKELHYDAHIAQLHALTQVSASCWQHVKMDCRHMRFIQSGWGWWTSWEGQKRLDWGGAEKNSRSCACGQTGTCDGAGHLCNCDMNDHIWRSDEGYLTDTNALPVKSVHFGDTKDIPLEMAFYTIGKLMCKGRASPTV